MREEIRLKIAEKLNKYLDSVDDSQRVYLAPWQDNRLAFEGTYLSYLYWENRQELYEVLDRAMVNTGYFFEFENSCEITFQEL